MNVIFIWNYDVFCFWHIWSLRCFNEAIKVGWQYISNLGTVLDESTVTIVRIELKFFEMAAKWNLGFRAICKWLCWYN